MRNNSSILIVTKVFATVFGHVSSIEFLIEDIFQHDEIGPKFT